MQVSLTLRERYEEKYVRRGPDDCWLWTAATHPFGHGSIYVGNDDTGKHLIWTAHRAGWLLEYDMMPPRVVRHTCDVPPCQNPAHWLGGTQADNIRDMIERGRDRKRGRPGEQHHEAKLTWNQVVEIRSLFADGQRQCDLSDRFGVGRPQIHRIVHGQRWKGN